MLLKRIFHCSALKAEKSTAKLIQEACRFEVQVLLRLYLKAKQEKGKPHAGKMA